ncbi:MAG: DUF1002 domain-containing protein [Clostridium sp.]|uniref:DUF1002 domain-containing protein n=1 Tax=Clostridium sp. TaxID=1506 RepID=UPI003064BB20
MIKKNIKKLAIGLCVFMCLGMSIDAFASVRGEYPTGEILSLGSDLNKAQEDQLKKYFKAPDNVDTIYVNNSVAIKQLGLDPNNLQNFTGGWYSSAYVKLMEKECGVTVKSTNLTLVSNDMLANALITSGILNAEVVASSPFPVTGESALAGILAGAEKIMGGELSLDGKKTAQEEIEVSLDLAEEIGQTEATAIINEIKTAIIKEKPSTEKEIQKIVEDTQGKYKVELSGNIEDRMVSLMSDINDLDLDYSKLKDTLDKASSKFKEDMAALGKELKDSGFFDKLFNWIKEFVSSIFN